MIGLKIPSYPNPFDPSTPLANAYGWISFETLDGSSSQGQFTLAVHPSEAAALSDAPPIAQRSYRLGQVLVAPNPSATPPVAGASVPTYAQLQADPTFSQAFGAILNVLLSSILADPALAGATVTTS